MDYCLVRLTSDDYRDFRKAYSQIRYSFFANDQGNQQAVDLACRFASENCTRTKMEFLEDVGNANRELYFLKVNGEIKGFMDLIFKEKVCDIFEFAVFEHRKGLGSKLFEEAYKIIKEKGCTKIELWCPYDGAQIFWRKKGFKPFFRNQQLFFGRKVR